MTSVSPAADILLCAGEDQTELLDIDALAEDVGGHVSHEGHVASLGEEGIFGSVDGVVGADSEIRQVGIDLPVGDAAYFVVVGVGAVEDNLLVKPKDVKLLDCLVRPDARVGVANLLSGDLEVHRNHGELEGSPALQEKDGVFLGDAEKSAQVCLGCVDDFVKWSRTMGLLDDAVAAALVVRKFGLGLEDDGTRQRRRTCIEVVNLHDVCFSFFPTDFRS